MFLEQFLQPLNVKRSRAVRLVSSVIVIVTLLNVITALLRKLFPLVTAKRSLGKKSLCATLTWLARTELRQKARKHMNPRLLSVWLELEGESSIDHWLYSSKIIQN